MALGVVQRKAGLAVLQGLRKFAAVQEDDAAGPVCLQQQAIVLGPLGQFKQLSENAGRLKPAAAELAPSPMSDARLTVRPV